MSRGKRGLAGLGKGLSIYIRRTGGCWSMWEPGRGPWLLDGFCWTLPVPLVGVLSYLFLEKSL